MVDRTPEPALDRWFTFDGSVQGEVGNWIVPFQNYAVAVNVYLPLRNGVRRFFGQYNDASVVCDLSRV